MDELKFPKWFKPEPGFKFIDADGDLRIYIGMLTYAKEEVVGEVRIKNRTRLVVETEYQNDVHVVATVYKRQVFLSTLSQDTLDISNPVPRGHSYEHFATGEIPKYRSGHK